MSKFNHALLAGALTMLSPAEVGPSPAVMSMSETPQHDLQIGHVKRAVELTKQRLAHIVTVEPLNDEPLPTPPKLTPFNKHKPSFIRQPKGRNQANSFRDSAINQIPNTPFRRR